LLLAVLCVAGITNADSNFESFRIGFSRNIFTNQNENDMIAAMEAWARTITTEHGVPFDATIRLYDSTSQMTDALESEKVDAVTFLLTEHPDLPEGLISGPCFRFQRNGSTHTRYVLLARSDGPISTPEDLNGTKLITHDAEDVELALDWLNAELVDGRFGTVEGMTSVLERSPKVSSAVLSVFFKKNDACLVSFGAFESMAELNPQLSTQLRVIATSPEILPVLFCYHSGLETEKKENFHSEVARLHESVTGQQVLHVYKSDRMVAVSDEEILRSLALMLEWRKAALP